MSGAVCGLITQGPTEREHEGGSEDVTVWTRQTAKVANARKVCNATPDKNEAGRMYSDGQAELDLVNSKRRRCVPESWAAQSFEAGFPVRDAKPAAPPCTSLRMIQHRPRPPLIPNQYYFP